jgi:hypothetical protein
MDGSIGFLRLRTASPAAKDARFGAHFTLFILNANMVTHEEYLNRQNPGY